MAAQVSLSELLNPTRAGTANSLDRHIRADFGEYRDAQNINQNRFADVYHEKLAERQAALRLAAERHAARPEPADRAESVAADRTRVGAAANDRPPATVEEPPATTAKSGESLPPGKHGERQEQSQTADSGEIASAQHKAGDSSQASEIAEDKEQGETAEDIVAKDGIAKDINAEDFGAEGIDAGGHVAGNKGAENTEAGDNLAGQLIDQPFMVSDQSAVEPAAADEPLPEDLLLADGAAMPAAATGTESVVSESDLAAQQLAQAEVSTKGSEFSAAEDGSPQTLAGTVSGNGGSAGAVENTASAVPQSAPANANHAGAVPGQLDGLVYQAAKDQSPQAKTPLATSAGFAQQVAGTVIGNDGEAEVTQQFKELLAKSAHGGQPLVTPGNAGEALSGLEKPAALGITQLESTTQEKALVALPASLSVRSSAPLVMPQTAYVTNLQMPVQSQEWQHGLAQKLVWFVSEKIQSAKIHVSPPELGPVEMKIQVTKDQAQIHIQSPHAVVRDLLEGTAQRLREMMAAQGIELTNFDVGGQGQQADDGGDSKAEGQHADGLAGTVVDNEPAAITENLVLDQLVDYYV